MLLHLDADKSHTCLHNLSDRKRFKDKISSIIGAILQTDLTLRRTPMELTGPRHMKMDASTKVRRVSTFR